MNLPYLCLAHFPHSNFSSTILKQIPSSPHPSHFVPLPPTSPIASPVPPISSSSTDPPPSTDPPHIAISNCLLQTSLASCSHLPFKTTLTSTSSHLNLATSPPCLKCSTTATANATSPFPPATSSHLHAATSPTRLPNSPHSVPSIIPSKHPSSAARINTMYTHLYRPAFTALCRHVSPAPPVSLGGGGKRVHTCTTFTYVNKGEGNVNTSVKSERERRTHTCEKWGRWCSQRTALFARVTRVLHCKFRSHSLPSRSLGLLSHLVTSLNSSPPVPGNNAARHSTAPE